MNNIKEFYNLDTDLIIENIMVDSRIKLNNSIFFCLVGLSTDGHKYVDKAIENGAICIVHCKDIEKKDNITYIRVKDTTSELNKFADYFYGYPSKKMEIYGVTGTNGKTSSTYLIADILNRLGIKTGYIGTLGYEYDGLMHEQYFTTPNINDLHAILKEMYDNGCKACALEVSSQGLDLHRTDSIKFDVASFSNLTHEHLDYHKNFENYFKAKAKLFNNLQKNSYGLINIDDPYGERMLKEVKGKAYTYGIEHEADFKANRVKLFADHSEFDLTYLNKDYPIYTNLVAKFNISNLLGVIGSLVLKGYELEKIVPLLRNLKEVPGRCMHIDEGQDFTVLVDYAHTPDGFVKILDYAKAITPNDKKIRVVFGLRGSGDEEKRPMCGQIVDEYCDDIYLTCDDNHFEPIESILDGIEVGIKKHVAKRYEFRDQAISAAIKNCQKGDTLCILSKGIEKFYKVGDTKIAYQGDDKVARRVLKSL